MNTKLNNENNSRVEAGKKFKWKRAIIVFGVAGLLSIGVIKVTDWITDNPTSVSAIEQTNTGVWTDGDVQNVIHRMSHEKVIADEKWGNTIPMTKENISDISEIIDANKMILSHYETYRNIIDKWEKGDFSTADDDHNAIWELQGGTIGWATGVRD